MADMKMITITKMCATNFDQHSQYPVFEKYNKGGLQGFRPRIPPDGKCTNLNAVGSRTSSIGDCISLPNGAPHLHRQQISLGVMDIYFKHISEKESMAQG